MLISKTLSTALSIVLLIGLIDFGKPPISHPEGVCDSHIYYSALTSGLFK
jgi:hypothetical protein